MIKIFDLIEKAKTEGYNEANAEAKACQDIILSLIAKSHFNGNITVKGGVVMRSISGNSRRATQDIDLDFIRYPLNDNAIISFVERLNSVGEVSIKIIGHIEELKQQDYHGKRINIEITDNENISLKTKIDLGVHKKLDIIQEEYCFEYYIYSDEGMKENSLDDVIKRVEKTLSNKNYIKNLKGSKKNWLDKNFSEVINSMTDFLRKLNNSI